MIQHDMKCQPGEPLVSVVIIFLDEERFLGEAIESVLAQSYAHWELLLCDDGSTDGSSAIAKRYASRSPDRVRYLAPPGHVNIGESAIRNLGIAESRGELVAFLDGDDVWLPEKLERQVALMRQNPAAAMLYGRTLYWFSWTGNPEDEARDCLTPEGFELDSLVEPPLPLIRYLQDESIYPCMCSVIVRREVFDEIGLFEADYTHGSQDMVFHAKLFLQAPVYVSSECWDRYRQHPDSFWGRMRQQGLYLDEDTPHPTAHKFLEWLEAYLTAQGVSDPDVWHALEKALWPYRHPNLFAFQRRVVAGWSRLRGIARRAPGFSASA